MTNLKNVLSVGLAAATLASVFEIRASIEVDAPLYAVWKIVSDAYNEPLYWQNLTVSRVRKQKDRANRDFCQPC